MEEITDLNLQKIIKFLELIGILKRIQRAGWVEVNIFQPESVADHTFRTAFLCMLFADIKKLDTLNVLRMALLHDLPEAIIGDLKPSEKEKETPQKEEMAMIHILNILPEKQKRKYMKIWNEFNEGKSIEAKLVRQLDKIEMALQAKEYEKSGSTSDNSERFIKSAEDAAIWPNVRKILSYISEEK